MLQTAKSSFLFIIIFTMFSAVFAVDNNADTKQPETIIHKAGIQVKSTVINDGVPSRQHMDTQGKSIEEIKGPDMSFGATQQYQDPATPDIRKTITTVIDENEIQQLLLKHQNKEDITAQEWNLLNDYWAQQRPFRNPTPRNSNRSALGEGFEDETFPPVGWQTSSNNTSNSITQSSSQAHGGTYSARFSSYSFSSDYNQHLITPKLTVATGDSITFWHYKHYSWASDTISVGISTTDSSVASFTFGAALTSTNSWTRHAEDLSAYVGQDIYIAIHYHGSYQYYLYVDDFSGPEADIPVVLEPGLFFSEYIEGSSNNKAIELYNASSDTLNLDEYQIGQTSNGSPVGVWEYFHVFPTGATLAPGDVWVIANSSTSSDYFDTSAADEVLDYPSVVHHNGDDARGVLHIVGTDTVVVDLIGETGDDPGSGWDVAGVTNATKDHTLIRKADVMWGNTSWSASAGTDSANSEWIVHDQNYFTNLGGHPEDPCFANGLTFTFNSGGWGYEVEFYMTNPAGDTLFSCFGCITSNYTNSVFTQALCLDDGIYTFWGRDDFGDTWNGGNYTLTDDDGNVVASGTGPPSGQDWYSATIGVGVGVAAGSEVNFEGLVLNDSETAEMLVVNAGFGANATMTLDSVSSSGASFSASATGLPLTLDPGDSAYVSVTFSPATAGDHEGYVILTNSGPGSPDTVLVSGLGVDAFFYEGFGPYTGSYTELPMDGWTIVDGNADADSIPQRYKTWYHDSYGLAPSIGNMAVYNGYSNGYWADETMITPLVHTPDLAKLSFKTYDYSQYLDVAYSVDGTTFVDLASVYVNGYWQQHDISLPEVDSLWVSFTYAPDSGSIGYTTYLNVDDVKISSLPSTYIEGFVYDQDTDLALGGVSVQLNGTELTTTGENALFLDSGFEDSSFVESYLTTTSGWWVYPTDLTNFYHTMEGDLIYNDTLGANGVNTVSVLEGDRALKMWGQFTEAENYTAIYQETGAVEEGTEMYIGAWAMTAMDNKITGGNTFFVAVNYFDAGWAWLGQDQSEPMDTSYAVDTWHYVDVHSTAPANVAHVQLQLTFYQPAGYASGSVYVDKTRATMTPGHYAYRGMDAGTYNFSFVKDDYNTAYFSNVGITDDEADTTWLNAGLAPENLTEFVADFEAGSDSGSTIITSGSASFMVMDSLRLTVTDSTVYTDTTSTGVDTTWTVYDTTEYNVDPYMGDGMLVYGPPGAQGSVYEDSAYAMWVSGEPIDITDYMAEGGNLSMNYRRNMNVATGDNFYVGVMLDDDSTVWWGEYNDHTGSTYGNWYYQSADLSWLRELDEDSSTTATPVIIFESDDSLVVGWGGAFDDFRVTGNPWFLPLPGHLHAESFGSYVPLSWEEPMSSGRVSYELHSFNMNELGGSQRPTIQTRTVTSYYDNSAMPRDVVDYKIHRRHWDGSTGQIGEWTPLSVTSTTSYLDFDVSEGDRADYRINVRFEGGDMNTPSNISHARVGVPYVMLVDSFATTTTFDSTFGEHWEIWSSDTTGASTWVIGDSTAAHSSTGYTGTDGQYYIPEHPDSAGTFAYISNGQTKARTYLMTPFLDFGGHASALLEFDAFAMTYLNWYDPEAYDYGHAAVYVRSQSEPWHLAANVSYDHNDGWVQERADLGGLVGNKDRVQFSIMWKHGTFNDFNGNGFAIDDFSVKTLDGPTNLTATSTTENVTLNWVGVDGRRANEYSDLLSAEEKELSSRSLNTINGKVLSQNGSMNRSLATDDDVMVTNNSRDTGDDISDPFILTIPESGDTLITGSTVGFTNDYDEVCPYSGSTSPDVVYKLVLADSVNGLIIDLCESFYDTKVYMYLEDSLATGDTTNIACNDDYCSASHGQSWTSYIELGHQLFGGVSAGTYYIVIDGYFGDAGEYAMDVKVMSPPPELVYNVFKDGQLVAADLPDSVFTYTDDNVSLLESDYWVNVGRIMEVSGERTPYGPPDYDMPTDDFDVRYVQSDHSNHVLAAMANTPPGAFALVTPPDGEELVITQDNIGDAQIFAWSQSVDPNGSVINYHISWETETDTGTFQIWDDTTGTAILIPLGLMAEIMTLLSQASGEYIADFSWTVYADDGWDVVPASNGPRIISVDVGWYLGMNDEAAIPNVFALHQNYPNPFNPVTTIRYDIPEQALVRIDIYNILGQKVAVLAEGLHEPGFHAVRWNGTNMYGNALSSGMYFYHIKAGDFRNVKKLLLVK